MTQYGTNNYIYVIYVYLYIYITLVSECCKFNKNVYKLDTLYYNTVLLMSCKQYCCYAFYTNVFTWIERHTSKILSMYYS